MENTTMPPFRLNNYKIDKVIIDNIISNDIEGDILFDVKGEFDKTNKLFTVYVGFTERVTIDGDEDIKKYIEIVGEFEFKELVDINEVPSFFWANSIAILYPYLRSFVSLVTMHSTNNTIILPLINLSSLGPELKQNTIEL